VVVRRIESFPALNADITNNSRATADRSAPGISKTLFSLSPNPETTSQV
jgi:hypothetical protein